MKIAVTSQDQINVTQHAGRCNRFWVFETEYADVVAKQWVELPAGTCFHDTTLPPLLSDINVLITGGMASELRYRLKQQAIQSVVTPEPTLNALSMPGSTARWKNYRQLRDLHPAGTHARNACHTQCSLTRLLHTLCIPKPLMESAIRMKLHRHLVRILFTALCFSSLPAGADSNTVSSRAIVLEDVSLSDFPTTLSNLKEQLKADGWNIVAEVNLGEGLAKRNVVIPGGMVVLELTSGKNAVPLLKDESTRYISALMPCSVSVYGMSDGRVMISRMNAAMLAGMMEPKVAEVMQQSSLKLDASISRALARSKP